MSDDEKLLFLRHLQDLLQNCEITTKGDKLSIACNGLCWTDDKTEWTKERQAAWLHDVLVEIRCFDMALAPIRNGNVNLEEKEDGWKREQ